ncbi:MAG: RNA polymerase subunit sigma [Methanoculleus sp. SDB]|nr:MAG: RNA polymerase subunit sigma [Methanoculleus sp. SDB]
MEIKIIELEKNSARIFFVGQGHTFMNALTNELLQDPLVDVAQYIKEFHFSDPEIVVTTLEGRTPLDAIMDACTRLAGYCDELLGQIRAKAQ